MTSKPTFESIKDVVSIIATVVTAFSALFLLFKADVIQDKLNESESIEAALSVFDTLYPRFDVTMTGYSVNTVFPPSDKMTMTNLKVLKGRLDDLISQRKYSDKNELYYDEANLLHELADEYGGIVLLHINYCIKNKGKSTITVGLPQLFLGTNKDKVIPQYSFSQLGDVSPGEEACNTVIIEHSKLPIGDIAYGFKIKARPKEEIVTFILSHKNETQRQVDAALFENNKTILGNKVTTAKLEL